MLQETPDDRDDADILRDPRNAGTQTADATYQKFDLHPLLRCDVEGADDIPIDKRVHLDDDMPRAFRRVTLDLPLDQRMDAGAKVQRRHAQLAPFDVGAVACQIVEEIDSIEAEIGIGGHDSDIGIDA